MAFVDQVLRNANHVLDVFRTARIVVGTEDVQSVHVLVVGFDVLLHEGFPIAVKFVRPLDDLIVDVREILNVVHVVAAGLKPPVNEVKRQVAACMTEMTAVVNGHTAHVHRDFSGLERGEVHLFSTSGVVQANRHVAQSGL